jgi:CBS domain containing-hemolysin-like protein
MRLVLFLVIIVLLLSFIALWVSFAGALVLTSRFELKKRAQSGDAHAKVIYSLTSQGREVLVGCLIGSVLATTLLTTILNSLVWAFFGAVLAALLVLTFGIVLPFTYGAELSFNLMARLAPLANKVLVLLRPVSRPFSSLIDRRLGQQSLLYSKEQLLHIIDDHTKSPYSDISSDEAALVRRALSFGDMKISEIMVPRKVVDAVAVDDEVVPLFMDELHKSGHSRFPVYDPEKNDAIVGTLYLRDLIGNKKSGKVKDLMSKKVFFVHEELDLNHALNGFIKTRHHMFIVVNTFEEFVGILTIEDVLEQVLGRQIVDEFDAYENLREVALLRAKKERAISPENMVK